MFWGGGGGGGVGGLIGVEGFGLRVCRGVKAGVGVENQGSGFRTVEAGLLWPPKDPISKDTSILPCKGHFGIIIVYSNISIATGD